MLENETNHEKRDAKIDPFIDFSEEHNVFESVYFYFFLFFFFKKKGLCEEVFFFSTFQIFKFSNFQLLIVTKFGDFYTSNHKVP